MRVLFIILTLVLPALAKATINFQPGLTWYVEVSGIIDGILTESRTIFYLADEKSVDGYTEMNLYSFDENKIGPHKLTCTVRVDGDKVWGYDKKTDEWLLCYDFGLKEGEGCYIYNFPDYRYNNNSFSTYIECMEITQDSQNPELTVLKLREYSSKDLSWWTEIGRWIMGIGGSGGVLENNRFDGIGGGSSLLEASIDGRVIYHVSNSGVETTEILDNISVNINNKPYIMDVPVNAKNLEVYSVDGKLMQVCPVAKCVTLTLPAGQSYILKAGKASKKLFIG